MYLVFDTETTGLPTKKKADPIRDYDAWPRIVQLAWSVYNNEGEVTSQTYYIKPDGFTIPEDVVRIHGITTEIATEQGVSLVSALQAFLYYVHQVDTIVAHNLEFDMNCILAELTRLGKRNPGAIKEISILSSVNSVCTKVSSTDFCKLPNMYGRGYKWPRLEELYKILFNEPISGAHNAVYDVEATNRCYVELVKKGIIT